MRIVHRYSVASSAEVAAELASFGVEAASSGRLATFEVDESDPRWPEIATWANERNLPDWVSTEFADSELDEARWFELVPEWHHGYPQPIEGSFGFLAVTYDRSEYCDACGTGLRQVAPFQMKAEPKWGRRSIMQLNWVFDEFFVTPEIWSTALASFGIGSRPVLGPRGRELDTVVQIVVEDEIEIATTGLKSSSCPSCGRTKYLPVTRGLFPSPLSVPNRGIARTKECFGSGGKAFHAVVVSHDLRAELMGRNVRGVSFHPLANG